MNGSETKPTKCIRIWLYQLFFLFSVTKSALSRTSLCLMVRRALCLGVLRMSYKATEVFRTWWKLEGLVTSNFEGYNWQAENHTKDNEWLDTQRWGCYDVYRYWYCYMNSNDYISTVSDLSVPRCDETV